VRAAALVWQGRLASLTELEPGTKPDAAVWSRILNQIEIDKTEQALAQQRRAARPIERAPRRGWLRSLALWRGATAAGALATVVAAVVGLNLYDQLRNAPAVRYVAVLSDEAARASMLVTFDPKRQQLTLQRVGDFREGVDKSLQLWALPPGGAPQSLGVLDHAPALRLAASESAVREVPAPGDQPGAGRWRATRQRTDRPGAVQGPVDREDAVGAHFERGGCRRGCRIHVGRIIWIRFFR
jgi:anti-sigma-K factor RskA